MLHKTVAELGESMTAWEFYAWMVFLNGDADEEKPAAQSLAAIMNDP